MILPAFNLPPFPFRIVEHEDKRRQIFDPLRKKFLLLTPEEWVRQHFIQYLINEKKFPISLFAIERGIKFSQRTGRFDVMFHNNKTGHPLLLVECKAPNVKINQETFDQIARYNMSLKVKYLVVTNGLNHYYCILDVENNKYSFIPDLPLYQYLQ